jgi:hypothetical protein
MPLSEGQVLVFPNVLKDIVNIEMEIQENTNGQISLIDMSGRLISLLSEKLSPGYHKFGIPIQNIANGSYILNCKIGDRFYNYPILILK